MTARLAPARVSADGRTRWLVSFALLAVVLVVWALSVPALSGPDEASHVVRAVGVARGRIAGHRVVMADPPFEVTVVQGPELLARAAQSSACYIGHGPVPASCASAATGSTRDVDLPTLTGRYPPAYYVVGFPARLVPRHAVLVMRLVTALVAAAILASALASAFESSAGGTGAVTGLAVALTPAALYLGSVVHPAGVEVPAAALLWTAGMSLAAGPPTMNERIRANVRRAAAGAVLLALSLPLSLVWLAAILAVLAIVAGRDRIVELCRRRDVRIAATSVAVSAVLAAGWVVAEHATRATATSGLAEGSGWRHGLGEAPVLFKQMVGDFGVNDAHAPAAVRYAWTLLLGLGIGLASLCGRRRQLAALASLVGLVVLVPVVLEANDVFSAGTWLGRHTLALAIGVPIVAFGGWVRPASGRLDARRVARLVVPAVAAGQVLAYAFVIRRYAVGSEGRLAFLLGSHWSPRLPLPLLLGVFVAAWVAIAWWLARHVPGPGDAPFPDERLSVPTGSVGSPSTMAAG